MISESLEGRLLAGRYRILRKLGAGGMGEVYAAVQEDLNRPVAVKVLDPRDGALDASQLSRFKAEAMAAAELGHPNIVLVSDFQAWPSEPAILVMERLEGDSLKTALERDRRFSETRAVFIATQVLAALGAAHAAGIVHRDIKPPNIFLTRTPAMSDLVKVLDFGIAKVPNARGFQTSPGSILGTPAYMAPEQAFGMDVDHRVDIYAVGACLFEMVAGRRPYLGASAGELIGQIVDGPPPPLRSVAPDVDPKLAEIIDRALARDPLARPASALDMLDMLTPWVGRTMTGSEMTIGDGPKGTAPMVPPLTPRGSSDVTSSIASFSSATGTAPVMAPLRRESLPHVTPYSAPPAPMASLPRLPQGTSKNWWIALGLGGLALISLIAIGAWALHRSSFDPRKIGRPPQLAEDYWVIGPAGQVQIGHLINEDGEDFVAPLLYLHRKPRDYVGVFDGRSRSMAWSVPVDRTGRGYRHAIVVGRRVLAVSAPNFLRAYDGRTGRELRSFTIPILYEDMCTPNREDHVAFVSGSHEAVLVDLDSGEITPTKTPPAGCYFNRSLFTSQPWYGDAPARRIDLGEGNRATPVVIEGEHGVTVKHGPLGESFVGLSIPDLKVLWTKPAPPSDSPTLQVLDVLEGHAYLATSSSTLPSTLERVDARSGEERWSVKLPKGHDAAAVAVTVAHVYVTSTGGVQIIDKESGKITGRVYSKIAEEPPHVD